MSGHFDQSAPHWDADPMKRKRAEAVAAAMRPWLSSGRRLTALEYGAGTGLLSFALRDDFAQITMADVSEGMLAVARDKIAAGGWSHMQVRKLDLTTDPLPDERWDVIYSLMTLHHIPDTAAILRQWAALLNPDGLLFVCDLDREDGSFHKYEFHGHHGFDREKLADLAKQAGFVDIRFETPFVIERGKRKYPLFLLIARKN